MHYGYGRANDSILLLCFLTLNKYSLPSHFNFSILRAILETFVNNDGGCDGCGGGDASGSEGGGGDASGSEDGSKDGTFNFKDDGLKFLGFNTSSLFTCERDSLLNTSGLYESSPNALSSNRSSSSIRLQS